MASVVDKGVEIDGETFSMDTLPRADCQLVIKAKVNLLGPLDLKGLVEDLAKLGKFIRIAYNGVAGKTDLQMQVQDVGYKVTKLADKSAVTVHSFKTTSRSVLQGLQSTYEYLLDGLEEMAVVSLSGLAKVAEKMSKAAGELHKEFDQAATDVEMALKATQREKGSEEKEKINLEEKQKEYEIEMKKAEQLQKDAMEAERKAEQYYIKAQQHEDKVFDEQVGVLKQVVDSVGQVLIAGISVASLNPLNVWRKLQEIGDNTAKEALKRATEEKVIHLENMLKQQNARREANQNCIEFAEKIKNCHSVKGLQQAAIDALHSSVGALKSLSLIMMNAALFWHQLQKHCEELTGEQLQEAIEQAMKLKEEQRIKVWTGRAFKRQAVQFYSQWVALDDICGRYMLEIKETRRDLYDYLQENPTIEESRENVRDLATEFADQLKKAQEELARKTTKTNKEIKELKG